MAVSVVVGSATSVVVDSAASSVEVGSGVSSEEVGSVSVQGVSTPAHWAKAAERMVAGVC